MLTLFKKLVAGLALALMLGVPVMACMASAVSMTAEEMACCQQMAGECHNMGGSSSHSCCEIKVVPDHVAVSAQIFQLHIQVVATAAPPTEWLLMPQPSFLDETAFQGHSPPASSPFTLGSVIRI